MKLLRRAWWGVSLRRHQSLILLLIMLAIGTLVIASLSIQSAAVQAKLEAKKALGSEVILKSYDDSGRGKIEFFSVNLAHYFTEHDDVKSYNYINNYHYVASNFNPVQGEINDTMKITVTGPDADKFKEPDIQLHAVLDTSRLKEFKNGVFLLEEGRHISEESSNGMFVLIERTLATENDLHIGDKLNMSGIFGSDPIETEIIGIYKTTETIEDVRMNLNMETVRTLYVPHNQIYIPFNALPSVDIDTNETRMKELILYINDPENISSFVNQAQANPLFDSSKFKFYSSEDKLKRMSLVIDQVASFSELMLWLIIISGAIVLTLLFIYFVKGRMHEMGILLSLGESKIKLVTQLIVEALILVILAFTLSVFTGNIVAKQATDTLIEQREAAIVKENELQLQGAILINGQNDGQDTMINALEIKLTKDIWLRLVYVTCFILIISIVFPAILIFRLKPTAILAMQE